MRPLSFLLTEIGKGTAMRQFALGHYVPRRHWDSASFESRDYSRMLLGFKTGRNVYSRWFAERMAQFLSSIDLHGVVIVCVPASTRYSHVRRWKRFSQQLCRLTGAIDGFDRVQVSGSRKRAHVTGEYELATNIKHYVHVDGDWFRGRQVLVIDDIWTTGQSSRAFIGAMQAAGADVVMAVYLAKTLQSCSCR